LGGELPTLLCGTGYGNVDCELCKLPSLKKVFDSLREFAIVQMSQRIVNCIR